MENSILKSVKKSLPMAPDCDAYDSEIIMHINTIFMILKQLGVGPTNGFRIEDETSIWEDFLPKEDSNSESVKTYICMKVQLIFDPPSNSSHLECMKQLVNELEWRLNAEAENSR